MAPIMILYWFSCRRSARKQQACGSMQKHTQTHSRATSTNTKVASNLLACTQTPCFADRLKESCPNLQAARLNCLAAVVDFHPAVQSTNPFPNMFSLTEEDSKRKKDGNGNFYFFQACKSKHEHKHRRRRVRALIPRRTSMKYLQNTENKP